MRIRLALLLASCAGAPAARDRAPAPSPAIEAASFPRDGECELYVEPGLSNPSPDVECVPPRRHSALDSARHRQMQGELLAAANCMVAAFEERPSEVVLAFDAAHLYEASERNELARHYYRRFLAEAPSHERSRDARRALEALE
jgi:hypothetical protein